ncbi:MAG: hypothetical protein HETSPECPRED_003823 [Heterodermia speciosa]|uniref:Uncharacterized protein n=1 Tax=Heterodermia speciosa TaxID=116794 RepID=A0A8H3F6K5_9LECA|nr:MAG: hypothetical protein HETSPECPRED_003823 [Heterodermia speciosa]
MFDSLVQPFRDDKEAFSASVAQWVNLPYAQSRSRSSRCPLWPYSSKYWRVDRKDTAVGKAEALFESTEGIKTVLYHLQGLPLNARILFLSLSISGLTSNLQSLVSLHDDIMYHRPDIETWIGYRLSSGREQPRLGQITREGVEWSFYELGKLRNAIVGQDQDPRYMMLVRVLFCIQKVKQDKADPVEIRYSDVTSLGEGCGRLTDAPNVKSYIENLVTGVDGENTSEDEDQDRDDGIDDSD